MIERSRFTQHSDGSLSAEASDLGLRNWPNTITLDDGQHAYRREIERDGEGDVTVVHYWSGRLHLVIFND